MLSILVPILLAQVGPSTAADPNPVSQVPPEMVEQRRMRMNRQPLITRDTPPVSQAQSAGCIDAVSADPVHSVDIARGALAKAIGDEKVRAGMCLGIALSETDRFDEARAAFQTARDAAAPGDHLSRARLGAMAGNAALAAGEATQAEAILSGAQQSADAAGDKKLGASIALDRARALVQLGQTSEAAAALAGARTADPDNATAWLLSATLARRQSRLDEAQMDIEQASRLAPSDPDVGLEAGVIAVLAGDDAAARRSWQSVITVAPASDAAATAKGYIAQLDAKSAK